ncbi:MFS general substrate transporter [Ceratobasidium sp. AG-I]|nr:MFS general substrate transporter [Ceratobasidium sp. AG-I]
MAQRLSKPIIASCTATPIDQRVQGAPSTEKSTSIVEHPANKSVSSTSNLPPMDEGFRAYSYIAASFVLEMLVWSTPLSYGVFLNHYTTHNLFDSSQNFLLPLVGTLSSGIMYMASMFVVPVIASYPQHRTSFMYVGLVLCVSGLLGAAFATKVWHLIMTQGVLYSVGGTILYFPVQVNLFEWFDKKLGLANGIVYSGTYLGGVVVPFIIEILLNKFGLRITFISLAIAYSVLLAPLLPFVRGRLLPSMVVTPPKLDWSFLRNPQFLILFLGNFLQGLGNFIPVLWLPTFATDINLNVTSGTLILALINASSILGSILLGHLSDKQDLRLVMIISVLGSSLAVFLLWGLASSLPPLVAFALVYGFLAAPFSSLWPKFCYIVSDDSHVRSRLMSIFIVGRGFGNILAAPVSSSLLRMKLITNDHPLYGYHVKGYGPLIIFTGTTMFAATIAVLYRSVGGVSKQEICSRPESTDSAVVV